MSKTGSGPGALTIIGPGRAGNSIASAAARAGIDVDLIGRRIEPGLVSGACVLLCVPDGAIAEAATAIGTVDPPARLVGHTSGATTLEPLLAAGAVEGCFSLHPLQTIPDGASDLTGAAAAVSGTNSHAETVATGLAEALGLKPFVIDEADRALYHAAASMASNFLITLEQTASDLLADSGVENPRAVLAPLLRRTLENWIEDGPEALTGPIARGDEQTVNRHLEAIERTRPWLLDFYHGLATATRQLADDRNREILR